MSVVFGATLLTGCATVEKMDKPTYERLHAEAKAAFDKSNSVQYAWTTAEDALEMADEAARKGDWESAIKQVKKAKEHSNLAYEQYEREHGKGPVYD
jgi:uncharacterized protein YceK